ALFVHGLGGSSRNWTDLMGLLSRPGSGNGNGKGGEAGPLLAAEALDLPRLGYFPMPAAADYPIPGRAPPRLAPLAQEGARALHGAPGRHPARRPRAPQGRRPPARPGPHPDPDLAGHARPEPPAAAAARRRPVRAGPGPLGAAPAGAGASERPHRANDPRGLC